MYNRDYYFIRPIVLLYYSDRCIFCETYNQNLHVHHLNKNVLDNKFRNLVPLCEDCHKVTHKLGLDHKPDLNPNNDLLKNIITDYLISRNKF